MLWFRFGVPPANPGWGVWLCVFLFEPFGVVRALRVCSTRRRFLPGTWSCAVVFACGVPFWLASWLCVGALRIVSPGCSRCAGRLFRRRGAFPYRGLTPPDLPGGCAGHVEAGQELGSWRPPLAPAAAGALGLLHVVPVQSLAMGLFLAGPSGFGLTLRALQCLGVYPADH